MKAKANTSDKILFFMKGLLFLITPILPFYYYLFFLSSANSCFCPIYYHASIS